MPKNVFVDEFRTNWFEQRVTNVVDAFKTNVLTRIHTNLVIVERIQTNEVTATETRPVIAYHTNWTTRFTTNVIVLTNTVVAHQTNFKTLTLTNWETVLVMKTNWVAQPVTNVVQIDLPSPAPSVAPSASPVKIDPVATGEVKRTAPALDLTQKMEFELTHNGSVTKANQYPILLTLKSAGQSLAILPVSEWRVERSDGAVMVLGSRPEFTATLPSGAYRVLARIRREEGAPLQTLRGTIQIAADVATQRSPASSSSAGR
jgi:hypothetical protein